MRQEFLILADGAESVNGKIHILGGGVDRHFAAQFPTMLMASIACSVLVEWGETNQTIAFGLRIVDEDENVIAPIDLNLETGRPAGSKPSQDLRTLLAVRGPFPIPKPGGYKIVMELNGTRQPNPFRFWVEQVQLPGGPNPPG